MRRLSIRVVARHGWLATLLLTGCRQASVTPAPAAPLAHYDGTVRVDPTARTLAATWRLTMPRTTGDSLLLLLNQTLIVDALTGAEVRAVRRDSVRGLTRLIVHLRPGRDPVTLAVSYHGVPEFGEDSINGLDRTWVELGLDSFWHPVVASFTQSLTARVRVILPTGWQVVTSGAVSVRGDTSTLVNRTPLVDIALAAAPAFARARGERTEVWSVAEPAARVATVRTVADQCADHLQRAFGARDPLPTGRFVLAPRGGPGYARANYIVLSTRGESTIVGLTGFICHELAHYWSSGADPSGPENWLNEGFAEFVSGRAVRALVGDSAWQQVRGQWTRLGTGGGPVWLPTRRTRPSARAAYRTAPMLLAQLEDRIGVPAMDRVLRRFMMEPLRTTPAVLAMMTTELGPETTAWFRAQLER